MPPVSVMIKPASGLCNMRCKYCFYADEMEKRGQGSFGIMSRETLQNVVRSTLEFAEGECAFLFQGGEPTLAGLDFFEDCIRLQEQYNKKKVRINNALQTNGYGLNEAWCRFFAEHNFLVGLSVDGIKATHDIYRQDAVGAETYFHTLNAAKMLETAGVSFNVLTVVNAKTAPKIRRIYEQYKKLGFRWQQYITCLDPLGEEQGKQEYSLTPKAYGQFLIDLFELWFIDLEKGRQPYIRQFENYIGILMGQTPESCEQRGTCTVQHVVEADGSVYPCDFYVLDKYRLGNLNEDTMEGLHKTDTAFKFVKNSYDRMLSCKDCSYLTVCRGGCRRHWEQSGSGQGHNYFCESYKMFFDACLPRMCRIAQLCAQRQ